MIFYNINFSANNIKKCKIIMIFVFNKIINKKIIHKTIWNKISKIGIFNKFKNFRKFLSGFDLLSLQF